MVPAFAKIPIKPLGETNPFRQESAPLERIGPELRKTGNPAAAGGKPALSEVGRSLSQR